jgi:hypothetical protein
MIEKYFKVIETLPVSIWGVREGLEYLMKKYSNNTVFHLAAKNDTVNIAAGEVCESHHSTAIKWQGYSWEITLQELVEIFENDIDNMSGVVYKENDKLVCLFNTPLEIHR